MTVDNALSALTNRDLGRLREDFGGPLIAPGDEDYDRARRVWNASVDRYPGLIARCTGVADVIAAVRFARERDLAVAVRGGGHSVAGNGVCDGGMVIDLSLMKGVRVDPGRTTAVAQGGVLWRELDRETQVFALATPGGVVSHTGVAGLTLGGGIGWLMRKHGATVDNVNAFDVVTASGSIVRADGTKNPELYWGMRGGGGNFGIATAIEFRLHPVGPEVLAGSIFFAMEDAVGILRRYRDWAADAPDEVTSIVTLRLAPPMAYLPQAIHGRPVVYLSVCYCGDLTEGQRVLRPLTEAGRVLANTVRPKPFTEHQQLVDAWSPHGWHYYWESCELPPFTDPMIDTIAAYGAAMTWPRAKTNIYHLGGAMGRVPDDATAFYSDRRPSHNASFNAVWADGDPDPEPMRQWAIDFCEALAPYHLERVYINFLDSPEENPLRAAYGPAKYERLVSLKREYDPTNFFRLNANIVP